VDVETREECAVRDEVKTIKSGPYTLVARLYEGRYHGILWHARKVVEDDVADSLTDAWARVWARLCERLSQVVHERGTVPVTAIEARDAFLAVNSRLSLGQKAMLRAHLHTPDRCMTATQLAKAAGYRSYSAANLQYGLLGAMLYGEMPRTLPVRPDGTPIMTFMIAQGHGEEGAVEGNWVWKMRDEIAEGLLDARIVA
jgi:hypothetical protein